ncbi:hypothetical protein [Legionella londiniensis]|uniref:Uncharacterized protein n=1 Tax=Legionella londiniensis TaxID=45068 RepID=A0A0W0VNT3_9GAMM|nr:hypothetical protein [Legionella londiniensis]KTD21724.1 hypothetical protein Llon_0889 [Legionella londiniensis]STX93439.1 Uncharacterised protein [Legionella londiniensis]
MRSEIKLKQSLSVIPVTSRKTSLILLGLSERQLEKISHLDRRKQYIRYKYLLSQMQYSAFCRKHNIDESSVLDELDKAYQIALEYQSNIKTEEYSPYSIGLQDLELRTSYKKKKKLHNASEDLTASIMMIGNKNSGVEPGFEAGLIEDLVFHLEKVYPDLKERLDYFNHFDGDFKKIYDTHRELPKYLVKQDYTLSESGKITPDVEDLKRANSVQQAYKFHKIYGDIYVAAYKFFKTGTPVEKNCDAVLEALTNDLARVAGMKVQEQTLYESAYETGELKLLLKGKWLSNANILGPLAGGLPNSHQNYRVIPLDLHPEGLQYLSNNSISDLAVYYATAIIHGDYDMIGSKGQNKLEINNEFYGIDFGHALRGMNQLVKTLLPNLHLPEKTLKKFKNFSIFYDAPRSELMKGALIYAKLAGVSLPEALLSQYGPEFKKRIDQIEAGAMEKVFADYKKKFEKLKRNNPIYRSDCEAILKKIEETREIAFHARQAFLTKLGNAIFYPPKILDILENLEKISMGPEKTALRSPDNTVLLNYVRVNKESDLIPWTFNSIPSGYEFKAVFKSEPDAMNALKALNNFTQCSKKIVGMGRELILTCPKEQLDLLSSQVADEQIKKRFHPKDYVHYKQFSLEKKIQEFIKQNQIILKPIQLSIKLMLPVQKKPVYQLVFSASKTFSAEELSLIHFFFPEGNAGPSEIRVNCNAKDLENTLSTLTEFKKHYTNYRDLEGKLEKINKKYDLNIKINIDWKNKYYYLENASEFNQENLQSGKLDALFTTLESFDLFLQKLQDGCDHARKEIDRINKAYDLDLALAINWQQQTFSISSESLFFESTSGKLCALGEFIEYIKKKVLYRAQLKNCMEKELRDLSEQYGLEWSLVIDWNESTYSLCCAKLPALNASGKLEGFSIAVSKLKKLQPMLEEKLNEILQQLARNQHEQNQSYFSFFLAKSVQDKYNKYVNKTPTAVWLKETVIEPWLKHKDTSDLESLRDLKQHITDRLKHVQENLLSKIQSKIDYKKEEKLLTEALILIDMQINQNEHMINKVKNF